MLLLAFMGINMYAAEVTDVLTWDKLLEAGKGTSYQDFSGKSITSQAVYAGNASSGSDTYIQLRSNNNNAGIVTTTSGGKLKSVTIEFNSKTTDRSIEVYGSNTAYTAATDLYGDAAGTKLGSIAADADNKTLTVEGDYTFVGLRSASGAIYVDKITIVWDGEAGNQSSDNKVILSWQSDFSQANKLTFEGGYTIQITGNESKNIQGAKAITIDGVEYTTMKVSNGAQNTLTLPEGKAAAKVTFYSYINYNRVDKGSAGRACYWKEVGGVEYTEETAVGGLMTAYNDKDDYQTNPDVRSFTFSTPLNPVTFTNIGEQACYVVEIEVVDAVPAAPEVDNIEAFAALGNGTEATLVLDKCKVTYVNGKYVYVRDNTGGLCFYNQSAFADAANTWQLGGKVKGTVSIYNGLTQMNVTDASAVTHTEGEAYKPVEIAQADAKDHICDLVKFTDAVTVVADGNKFYNNANKDIQIYDNFKLNYTIADGDVINNLTGVIIVYNTQIEIAPTEAPVATGIDTIKADVADATIYNLAGQKVGKDYKGIVIVNGKKFMQK